MVDDANNNESGRAKKAGRKISETAFRNILARIREGGLPGGAVEKEGVPVSAFYSLIERDPARLEELKKAVIQGPVSRLAAEAHRRAVEGVEKPVFHKGVEVGSVREYSDTLLMFLLKKWHPEVYDDKPASLVNTVVNNPAKAREIEERLRQADEVGDRLLARFEAGKEGA